VQDALSSRPALERRRFETGRSKELLDPGAAAKPEPDRAIGRLEGKLETQEWAATAFQKQPVESVPHDGGIRIETPRVAVGDFLNLSKPS